MQQKYPEIQNFSNFKRIVIMQDIGIVFKRPEIYTLLFLTYMKVLTFKKKQSYLSSTAQCQASRPGQKRPEARVLESDLL
jgi:hypothetical protein